MDTPAPLDPDRREAPIVPDPHRDEALPEPQSGVRPGVDAAVVRPEQDEPGGPLAGLVGATAAQAAEEATPGGDPEAEEALAEMGVEEEGVESGQLLGFIVATLATVGVLSAILIYLLYMPYRDATGASAASVDGYPDLTQSLVDGRAKLNQAQRDGDTYTITIGDAMQRIVGEYSGGQPPPQARLDRAAFNTLMVNRTAGRAVQAVDALPERAAAAFPQGAATGEEVGVDATSPNDADNADDAPLLPEASPSLNAPSLNAPPPN